jgi:hypothetical protein
MREIIACRPEPVQGSLSSRGHPIRIINSLPTCGVSVGFNQRRLSNSCLQPTLIDARRLAGIDMLGSVCKASIRIRVRQREFKPIFTKRLRLLWLKRGIGSCLSRFRLPPRSDSCDEFDHDSLRRRIDWLDGSVSKRCSRQSWQGSMGDSKIHARA